MIDFASPTRTASSASPSASSSAAEILPNIREWDEAGEAHPEVFAKMGGAGLPGRADPRGVGRGRHGLRLLAILCEELERADTAYRVVMSVHVGLNSLALLQWGTDEQKRRWLVPQAQGTKLATFASTEPGVGTDAGRAPDDRPPRGRRLRPQRRKIWISLADLADHFLVFATVDRAKKHRGVTAFMLERGMKGLTTGTLHGKLGIRAGNTGLINLDDVRGAGREPDRRGGRGVPRRDERDRPGALHGGRRRGRARPGLPGREPARTPTSARRSARRSGATSW